MTQNRFSEAVGLLMKATDHLEQIGGNDSLLRELDAFIRTVHPLECGPLATQPEASSIIASHLRDFAQFLPENKREDFNATIDDLLQPEGGEAWHPASEPPKLSGWRWVDYWTKDLLPGVAKLTVGDVMGDNVLCWRFRDSPVPQSLRAKEE